MKATEYQESLSLVQIAQWQRSKYPEASLLVHIPNEGKRTPRAGQALKNMGMARGFPDYILPVARGGYHSLAIELKAKGGRVSPEQKAWLDTLREQGWAAHVAFGAGQAWNVVKGYLDQGRQA